MRDNSSEPVVQGPYANLQMVTPKMVRETVLSDERTSLWFAALFSRPAVLERIGCSSGGQDLLARYRSGAFLPNALFGLTVALGGVGFFVLRLRVGLLGAACLTLAAAFLFMMEQRKLLAALAAHLVELDRELIPSGMTFYQMSEFYVERYGVRSLVDVIWAWDQSLRNTWQLLFVIGFGVLFLPVWKLFLLLAAGLVLVTCVVRMVVMARGGN